MKNNLWYNLGVPTKTKKSYQVLVKIDQYTYDTLAGIAEGEDRPLGYVARELMIRGIVLYENDGRLRDEPPVRKLAPVVARIDPGSEMTKEEIRRSLKVPVVLKGKVRR